MSLSVSVEHPSAAPTDGVDPDRLFGVLETASARRILAAMGDDPVTASELASECGIANSTMYRQLGELIDARLVSKSVRLDQRGHHASQYERAVSDISISLDEDRGFCVSLH